MLSPSVHQRFADALDALVAGIKKDRSILAAILCGSLSHDTVWDKSDIDLLLITADDKNAKGSDIALNAAIKDTKDEFQVPETSEHPKPTPEQVKANKEKWGYTD